MIRRSTPTGKKMTEHFQGRQYHFAKNIFLVSPKKEQKANTMESQWNDFIQNTREDIWFFSHAQELKLKL